MRFSIPQFLTIVAMTGCASAPPPPTQAANQTEDAATRDKTSRKAGQPEVAASPEAVLKKDAVTRIQSSLIQRGYNLEKTGRIDDKTQTALRTFQKQEKVAATGMPDQLTLRRLNLDPTEIYGDQAVLERDELETEKQ